ncbi:TBC-domain-containing protein [Rhizopus microsporus ATCC 52813]|uniref:TBC-domain-containing protein n=1 Tax=Rhizopus microsporus ATCC 52813 TaxID=1340429 RepID=A0A2G4T5H1_RHIZD|nr:TBC-domain-containing protein [Rhizopus microsporus ATCC 52813]PHZ16248.1 TBC-domain-containing protein [Rhizopus microsporus ATCC 52813]
MTTAALLAPEIKDRLQEPTVANGTSSSLLQPDFKLEKSTSTSLAERRRLPVSPEKLKLYSQITATHTPTKQLNQTLKRLEEENAKLPPQDSEEYLLARLERQNVLLNADPKSVCIESNRLQADFNTVRKLVTDATFSPTRENYEESIQAMLAKSPITSTTCLTTDQDDWDFWQAIVEDYPAAAAKLPHLLSAKLRCGGIPHRIRGLIWQSMAQSSSLNLESCYEQLLQEDSSYERVIQRDLSRTFPQLDMFKDDGGEGQLALGRLLKAYSLYDTHVGYCQGLAFLAGPLLMTMPENQAFCIFVRLMETYEMRTMFTLNMEGLHLRLHQFQTILAQVCPRLEAHLEANSIHTPMYASQWYLTLFAYTFPISLVLRIYDLVFAEGAVETITRVAIAIMKKNEETLLAMDDFEELMMYLSSRKLYQIAYNSDPEAVIQDAMSLSTVITRQKMDSISENYNKDLEQETTRAQQLLNIRFSGWKSKKKNKRESWFNWGQPTQSISAEESLVTEQPPSPTTPDRFSPMLHEQIEDLVMAVSELQRENTRMSEELMARRIREMDLLAERDQLLKKVNIKDTDELAKIRAEQPSPAESVDRQLGEDHVDIKLQPDFVESLKSSGEFGALVAGALSSDKDNNMSETKFDEVTSELVNIKLANFEMGLKYQELCQNHENVLKKLKETQEGQAALVEKIMSLQTTIESLQIDKEKLLQEQEALVAENEALIEKNTVAKKTLADLQLEKMNLESDCQQYKDRVKELEDQRREYLMPRGSFTEEVLAAHQTLFGSSSAAPPMNRRHTVHMVEQEKDKYQAKYIESDLKCRELEKLLAEAKYKLVEYEANAASTPVSSPRASLQQPRRPISIQTKRSSLSALINKSGPTSPPYTESNYTARESIDSLRSTTSTTSQKRSSIYSRFFNTLSGEPLTEEAQAMTNNA